MKNIKIKMTKAEKIIVAITIITCMIVMGVVGFTTVPGIAIIYLPLIPQLFMPAVVASAKKNEKRTDKE